MTASSLTMQNASFGYQSGTVLSGVSLEVQPGRMLGILGPNGSGKTTLVRGATKMLPTRSGVIQLLGRQLESYSREELARNVAVVPQEGIPVFPYTVLETVLMGRAPWLRPFSFEGQEDLEIAAEALRAVAAEDLAARDLTELSGGERQRTVIARALAQQARFILADEPTAHLDLRHAVSTFRLLGKLKKERQLAILVVTHDVNLAAIHCDHLLLLAGGQVVAEGTPREVLQTETLSEAYSTPVLVEHRADGTPFVIPGA